MDRRRTCAMSAWLLLLSSQIGAHPVSQVATDVEIRSDHIHVQVEINAEDLIWFHLPGATNRPTINAEQLRRAAHRHQRLLKEGLTLLDDQGRRLAAHSDGVDLAGLGSGPIPVTGLKTRVVFYRQAFPLTRPTRHLTLAHEIGGPDPPVPCSMDLTWRRNGAVLGQPVNLGAGVPHTVELVEDSPPTSLAEIRQRKGEHFRRRLGLTDLNSVASFIHREPGGIRHELIVPHHELARWLPDSPRPDSLNPADWASSLLTFLRTNSPVLVDGRIVPPVQVDFRFLDPGALDVGDDTAARPRHPLQARAAIVVRHPAPGLTNEIRLKWSTYTRMTPYLKSMVFSPGHPPQQTYFTAQRPEFNWRYSPSPEPSSLFRLREELCRRLDIPPTELESSRLEPDPAAEVLSTHIVDVSPQHARWRLTRVTRHWGHRHEEEREYTAEIGLDHRNRITFHVRNNRLLKAETVADEIRTRNIFRSP
jgi:hypothetical protein